MPSVHLPWSGLRLLAVHAHPDDESTKGAATLARYAAEGAEVLVCTMTAGERGEVLNPNLDLPEKRQGLPRLRRAEMEQARQILRVEHIFAGFIDSGQPEPGEELPTGCFALAPLEQATAPLVRVMRDFRPHVVVIYDEIGGYPYPIPTTSRHIRSRSRPSRRPATSTATPGAGNRGHRRSFTTSAPTARSISSRSTLR